MDVNKKKKDNFYIKININSMRKQKREIQMDKENQIKFGLQKLV